MNGTKVRLGNRGLVECPRWHDGELWFADWTSGEILALSEDGTVRVATTAKAPPLSFDFGPEGNMYVVASGASHLLRFNGSGMEEFAELGAGSWNEIVIGPEGRIYVNGPAILLIHPDGTVETQAEGFQFPNGMALSTDIRTLVCAESWAKRLISFDIAADGQLSNRRIWADLPGPPDGINDFVFFSKPPDHSIRNQPYSWSSRQQGLILG